MRRGNSIDISNLSDSGSKHSHHTNSSKKSRNDPKTVEITDKTEKIFIFTLMTFHLNNKLDAATIRENQPNLKLYVGYTSFKTPDFFFSLENGGTNENQIIQSTVKFTEADAVSIKKCVIGLIHTFKEKIES